MALSDRVVENMSEIKVDWSLCYLMERFNAEDDMFRLMGHNRYEEAQECLDVIIAVDEWFKENPIKNE